MSKNVWTIIATVIVCLAGVVHADFNGTENFSSGSCPANSFVVENLVAFGMCASAAFDGTNYLVGIQEGSTTEDTNSVAPIVAQLISQAGSPVGPLISTGRTGGAPYVAFDGTDYLMVWPDDARSNGIYKSDEVYGQFVSPAGALVGSPFVISALPVGPVDEYPFGISFDGNNYLVMYCIGTDVSFGTPYDTLAARFVSPAGVVGSEITLATGGELPDDGLARFNDPPAVAFNGNNYLVTWMQHNGDSSNDVYGVLVSKTGTVSTPFRISQNTSTSHNPMNVASDGSNFFVVWPYDTGDGSEDPALWELHGRLVTADGGFDSAEFTVAGVTNLPFLPYIAFDGANYFVTWTDQSDSSDWNITGQFVTQTGALLGSPLNLVTCPGNQVLSPVVYGAGNDLVLWNDGTNIDFDNFNATAIKGLFIPVAPTTVATPNIAGKTAGDANTAIVGANLVVGTITTAYSNTVAVGKVISQSPAAGTKVATGSTVSYVRSLGKPVVPNVVGMAAADANTAITSVDNLKVGTITTAYSNTVDAGNVISQNPTASKTVAIGSKVKYVRSLGKKPIVPNVVGMAASDANTAIVNANLVVGTITTKYSNTVDAGKVISQNPAAGKAVAIGSKVKYVRSLGKKP